MTRMSQSGPVTDVAMPEERGGRGKLIVGLLALALGVGAAAAFLTSGVEQSIPKERREKMAGSTPLNRWCTPEEVAKAMLYLASDDAAYVTGQTIVIDGGATLHVFKV